MESNYQKQLQEEDIFDEELQAMGIPFEDETAPKEMPKLEAGTVKASREKTPCKMESAESAGICRVQVRNSEANLMKRGLGCIKWLFPCGGIAMLLWWFQINDLMALQAAYPCIIACGILGGFGVGMHSVRGHRYE